MKVSYTIYKNKSINIFHKGDIFNVEFKDIRFKKIEALLEKEDHSEILPILDPKLMFQNEKSLSFVNDRVFYKDEMLPLGIANAIFEGIVTKENIGNYLYIWSKISSAIKDKKTDYWKFQANKLFFNIYPFEEYLLCLTTPDHANRLPIENFLFLNNSNTNSYPHIVNLFMKKLSLSNIMKELNLSGDKLKKVIKQKLIANNVIEPVVLFFAEKMQSKVKPDQLIELIENTHPSVYPLIETILSFLDVYALSGDYYNINKVKKILTQSEAKYIVHFVHTLNQNPEWHKFVLPDFKDLNELSTFIHVESLKLKFESYVFNYEEMYPHLANIQFPNNPELTMLIPHTGIDLVLWGQSLGNCIGGEYYMEKAKNNKCLLLGFAIDNKITFSLEIIKGKLKQFEETRKFNKYIAKYRGIICKELLKQNIIQEIPVLNFIQQD